MEENRLSRGCRELQEMKPDYLNLENTNGQ